jgi:hypothetical protein
LRPERGTPALTLTAAGTLADQLLATCVAMLALVVGCGLRGHAGAGGRLRPDTQPLSPISTSIVPPHTSQRSILRGAMSTSVDRPHEKQ